MPTAAKMRVQLKFSAIPYDKKGPGGCRQIVLEADGREVTISLRPSAWEKLLTADATWPSWTAKISGRMGGSTRKGFALRDPALQVMEAKEKKI